MTPMECMVRLVSLLSPPRYPLVRYLGYSHLRQN